MDRMLNDRAFDDAAAEMDRVFCVAGLPFVVFADVDQLCTGFGPLLRLGDGHFLYGPLRHKAAQTRRHRRHGGFRLPAPTALLAHLTVHLRQLQRSAAFQLRGPQHPQHFQPLQPFPIRQFRKEHC